MKQNKRTDIHCPSRINPQDYECVGLFHSDMTWNAAWGTHPLTYFEENCHVPVYESPYKCDICGAAYRWGAVLLHKPSDVYITVGQICATKHAVGLSEDPKVFQRRMKRDMKQRVVS